MLEIRIIAAVHQDLGKFSADVCNRKSIKEVVWDSIHLNIFLNHFSNVKPLPEGEVGSISEQTELQRNHNRSCFPVGGS